MVKLSFFTDICKTKFTNLSYENEQKYSLRMGNIDYDNNGIAPNWTWSLQI